MKDFCKKIWTHFEGINGIILLVYSVFIVITHAFVSSVSEDAYSRWALFGVAICLAVCPAILRFAKKLQIKDAKPSRFIIHDNVWRVIFFAVPFLVFLLHYIAYYPGAFSPDSINQYEQAITNSYNDWHPVFQTLFAIKLPLVLTGGWIGSIVLFQIILFSLVIAYSLFVVRQYTNTTYSVIAMLFIILNPETASMALFPWKDVSFAIGALLLLTYALRVYFTKGEWIKRPIHLIFFVLTAVATTLFRHNGLLFTIPLILAVAFIISKKRAVAIILSFLVLFLGIRYPLYSVMGVEQPNRRQVETLGLPMTVIGAAVTYDTANVDADILEFAYKVAPPEVWQGAYYYGSYNEVKWDSRTNNDVIEEYGTVKVLIMAARCIKDCPDAALKGLIKLTNVVYTIFDDYRLYITPYLFANDYGITSSGVASMQELDMEHTVTFNNLFPHLFMYVGAMHLVLLISILAKCKLNKWCDWKKLLFILPIFIYNLVTTLLLTGSGDSCRFFYYTFLLMPVLLVFLYKTEKEGSTDSSVRE